MANAADEFDADQLLKKSKRNPQRDRLRRFVGEHDEDTDLKTARQLDDDGETLSSIVIDHRDERR